MTPLPRPICEHCHVPMRHIGSQPVNEAGNRVFQIWGCFHAGCGKGHREIEAGRVAPDEYERRRE